VGVCGFLSSLFAGHDALGFTDGKGTAFWRRVQQFSQLFMVFAENFAASKFVGGHPRGACCRSLHARVSAIM
jgi:hypothetical protein